MAPSQMPIPGGSFRPGARVAVIGGGPGGLAVSRRLLNEGLDVTVFERRRQPGGVWVFEADKSSQSTCISSIMSMDKLENLSYQRLPRKGAPDEENVDATLRSHAPSSACYRSLTNNIALPLMQFEGHSYPPGTSWFVSHRDILQYLQRFSHDFGTDAIAKYNTSVLKVTKRLDGRWDVLTRHSSLVPGTEKLRRTFAEDIFDSVVVSTGHYDKPFIPSIPGLSDWASRWPESIVHSKDYVDNSTYKNQTILLIGAGSSAFDIGREVAFEAKTVYQSIRMKEKDTRTGPETLFERTLRSVIPENVIKISDIKMFRCHGDGMDVVNAEVLLADGTVLQGIDRVIFCTGYRFSLPFLSDYHGRTEHDTKLEDYPPIITDGVQLHNLHEDMFYIHDPTLAFIGVKFEVATFPFFDVQSTAVAAVFSGRSSLPSCLEMHAMYRDRQDQCGIGKKFHVLGWKKERLYMAKLAASISTPFIKDLVQYYDCILQDTRARQMDAFKQFLLRTTKFRNKTRSDIEEMIEQKARDIELELAVLKPTTASL